MAKSSGGRNFVLLMMAAVGIGLAVRFKCRKTDAPPPKPPSIEEARPIADAAVVEVTPDAAQVQEEPKPPEPVDLPDAPVDTTQLTLVALSADGAHALLVNLNHDDTPHLRVVNVDTRKIETDLELPGLVNAEDLNAEPVVADLVKARAVLRGFPLGATFEMASSADGTRGAFNHNIDDLHTMAGDKVGAKVPLPAAYYPLINGDTMVFRGYDGTTADGEGKYSLFAMPLAGGKPKKVSGTDGYTGRWAFSAATQTLRIEVRDKPCILDIAFTKTPKLTKRTCLEGEPIDVALSPSGEWVAWTTRGEVDADGLVVNHRARLMSVVTGKTEMDLGRDAGFIEVSDDGHVAFMSLDGTSYWDPKRRTAEEITHVPLTSCIFRGSTSLVCERGGTIGVVDLEN